MKTIRITYSRKKDNIKPLQNELKSIISLIEDIEGRRNKYLKLYENNLIDHDMIIDRLNDIREERDSLLKRKSEIEAELGNSSSQKLDEVYVRNILVEFNKLISLASFEQQKMLLQLIIEKINVNEDKEIESTTLRISKQLQAEILYQALSDNDSDRAFSIEICI